MSQLGRETHLETKWAPIVGKRTPGSGRLDG
jgi:hypothetical protein